MTPEWATLGDVVSALGVVGLLALALIGGKKGWYVWGREHQAMVSDRDYWRDVALRALTVGERVVERELPPRPPDGG